MELPPELKIAIFSYLDLPDLFILERVCKSWKDILADTSGNSLWALLICRVSPQHSPPKLIEPNWKQACVNYYRSLHGWRQFGREVDGYIAVSTDLFENHPLVELSQIQPPMLVNVLDQLGSEFDSDDEESITSSFTASDISHHDRNTKAALGDENDIFETALPSDCKVINVEGRYCVPMDAENVPNSAPVQLLDGTICICVSVYDPNAPEDLVFCTVDPCANTVRPIAVIPERFSTMTTNSSNWIGWFNEDLVLLWKQGLEIPYSTHMARKNTGWSSRRLYGDYILQLDNVDEISLWKIPSDFSPPVQLWETNHNLSVLSVDLNSSVVVCEVNSEDFTYTRFLFLDFNTGDLLKCLTIPHLHGGHAHIECTAVSRFHLVIYYRILEGTNYNYFSVINLATFETNYTLDLTNDVYPNCPVALTLTNDELGWVGWDHHNGLHLLYPGKGKAVSKQRPNIDPTVEGVMGFWITYERNGVCDACWWRIPIQSYTELRDLSSATF
ncbi:hypothetical protein HDV01_004649 [Terramyces sp. JEL0728]|nr:hypothetical protein HDV01_004649 [Terramyces sp. JEL0728]